MKEKNLEFSLNTLCMKKFAFLLFVAFMIKSFWTCWVLWYNLIQRTFWCPIILVDHRILFYRSGGSNVCVNIYQEKDERMKSNPDLYFNSATVSWNFLCFLSFSIFLWIRSYFKWFSMHLFSVFYESLYAL